jgi:hypothetical protein
MYSSLKITLRFAMFCYFIIFFTILCIGCGAGLLDFSDKLENGYYYYCNSAIDRFIAPKTWNNDTPMIPSKVIKYIEKGNYIIAKREVIQKSINGSRIAIGIFDYWVLNTSQPEVVGPMSKYELTICIKKLGLKYNEREIEKIINAGRKGT